MGREREKREGTQREREREKVREESKRTESVRERVGVIPLRGKVTTPSRCGHLST